MMMAAVIENRSNPQVNEILRGVSRLRPLPGNSTRILKALDDPSVTAGELADLVALDQALTAYILRVANSAGLGYRTTCSSIKDAVMRLGFKQVRSLVLSTVASGPLASRLNGYRLGDKELWYHSLATASGAHWLATALQYPDPEEAYVAGLLHDIGKLLLDQYVLADYTQIVELMQRYNAPVWQVEEHLFGIDHAAAGGLMTGHWQFPAALVESIRFHHTPSHGQAHQGLAAIVNLANALVPQERNGLSALEGRVIHPDTLQILRLDEVKVERLSARLAEAMFEYESRQVDG
jgi:putative nucleotidyltransferase with HDIG domain